MSTYRVSMTRRIQVPARVAYDIIADYRDAHQQIVPPEWFSNLCVESGGVGAGTRIRFDVRSFGSTKTHRATIAEPTPGRVLVESEIDDPIVTTFSVEPVNGDRACDVTVSSELQSRDGMLGKIEQWLAKPFLRRVYAAELDRLDALARSLTRSALATGPAAA
jgi:hypothetical protein